MELFFDQIQLHEALQKVQKAIPIRTPMTILKGVCLELKGDLLSLSATDLELGIQTVTGVNGIRDGSIILPERFIDIVRHLPPGQVHLLCDGDGATIQFEDITFRLNGFPAEEFPLFPQKGEGEDLVLPGFLLKNMLRKTLLTVSTDQSKPSFTGVNFLIKDNVLQLTSSDTFRLSLMREKIKDLEAKSRDVIIPAKALRELIRIVRDDEPVTLNFLKGMAIFSSGETVVTTSLLAGVYPNVSRVIPQDAFTTVRINKNLWEMALGRAALPADADIHTINLKIADSKINIQSQSSLGNNEETLPLKTFEGEEFTIIMNIKFLQDVIKVLPDSEIIMRFKGSEGPCVVESPSDPEYLYLALPVKPD